MGGSVTGDARGRCVCDLLGEVVERGTVQVLQDNQQDLVAEVEKIDATFLCRIAVLVGALHGHGIVHRVVGTVLIHWAGH